MDTAANLRFTQEEVQQLGFWPAGLCFEADRPPSCCVSQFTSK